MQGEHQFEDAGTGDEKVLDQDMTYTVVSTFVEVLEDGTLYFTHRVREGVQHDGI